jgi:hypothetical protein
MAHKQIFLFATRRDLEPGIRLIEAERSLKYALGGMFLTAEVQVWQSLLDVENIGQASGGNQSLCEEYLVFPKEMNLNIRDVPQHSGMKKYAVDQLLNPASIAFRPGGLFGKGFLIVGRIGSASNQPESLRLLKEFSRALTHNFQRHDMYFVGNEVLELHRTGTRLITMHIHEDSQYDLKIP